MTEANVYDQFEYPGYSFPDTHPDRLAVMASLHGLSAAAVESCRVLEIGCGEGANLIPLAQAIPGGEFTGFDLAASPIRRGQERSCTLQLRNLRLFQADLMQVGSEPERGGLGEYDYIIAHGLYAWVPEPVRDRLLALCSAHLAPRGVAFVSYNAYPGSHIRNILRDVLGQVATEPGQDGDPVARGIDLLEALIEVRAEDDPFRRVLGEQFSKMRRRAPNTTFHDELAPAYAPLWFSSFLRHAEAHGLQYLSEAELPVPSDPSLNPRLMEKVRAVAGPDWLRQEDLLDFSRMRMYRETLLVRAGERMQSEIQPEALRTMRFASSAVSASGERSGQRLYSLQGGVRVAVEQAPAIGAMEQLIAAWPCTLSFQELCTALQEEGLPANANPARLLLQMAIARMVELHCWQPAVVNTLSLRPCIPHICRQEAEMRPYAATLWHGTLQLDDPIVRKLLLLADGTRTRAELLASLAQEFPTVPQGELEGGLGENLERFRRAALFSG